MLTADNEDVVFFFVCFFKDDIFVNKYSSVRLITKFGDSSIQADLH